MRRAAWLSLLGLAPACCAEGRLLVLSLALPDGLGDVAFGRCAVEELQEIANVTWIRVYSSGSNKEAGEELAGRSHDSLAFEGYAIFDDFVSKGQLDDQWSQASEVFLAPWIFGLGADGVLTLASRLRKPFWALSEYGRGMGNLHGYSSGWGHWIPTGWPSEEKPTGGVFKTILKSPSTGTDWRAHFQALLGLAEPPRLWWAYGRQDSAKVHSFRLLSPGSASDWPTAAKVIPLGADGGLAMGKAKTTGELLRDQIDEAVEDASRSPPPRLEPRSEVEAGVAGQLSHLLVNALSQPMAGGEVIVAPNAGLQSWAGADAVQITSLELVPPSGSTTVLDPNRHVFLVASAIPRREMRSLLEQCERDVVATGDQSVAEAVLLGKLPFVAPDAKVASWRAALAAAATGVEAVPDLGQTLRDLVANEALQARYMDESRRHGEAVQARLAERFGPEPGSVLEQLARAGMYG